MLLRETEFNIDGLARRLVYTGKCDEVPIIRKFFLVNSKFQMTQFIKNSHYVPQMYLNHWAIEKKVATYRLLVPNGNCPLWKNQSIKGIAYRQHLYTYNKGGKDVDDFERWLESNFEGPAKEALTRVLDERRLSPDHWRHLFRFAAAQDARTPARLREFMERQQKTLPSLMEETLRESIIDYKKISDSGNSSFLEKQAEEIKIPLNVSIEKQSDGSGILKAEITLGRQFWLWSIRHTLTKTLSRIGNHRWTILHAPSNITWPTSDNPLIRLNFYSPDNYDFLGGWGREKGDIILPLSPKHLLYTCIKTKPYPRGTVLDQKTALSIQKMIIEHAHRYVFSREPIDAESIRPRLVSQESYQQECKAWDNWHFSQSDVNP